MSTKVRKPFYKKLWFWAVAIIIVIVATTGENETQQTSSSAGTASSPAKKEEKIYQLNEVVPTSKAEVTLANVENKEQVGNEYLSKKASEGGTFVAIQYKIKNVSDKPLSAFSLPSVKLVDEKGTKYDFDIDATSNYALEKQEDNSKILSDLNPGIAVTDSKVFEISKEAYAAGKWFVLVDGKEKVAIK